MSTRRVLLIFAGICIAATAVVVGFTHLVRRNDLSHARSEIAAWETRFTAARTCLLGDVAASAKTSEALAIREMRPSRWDPTVCAPLVARLTRDPGVDSGIDAVEVAWRAVDKAASAAALAYTLHISPTKKDADDPLPAALDALDAARSALRAAAKLPTPDTMKLSLRSAQVIELRDVTWLEPDAMPSAKGLVLFGKSGDDEVQVILTAGGTPQVTAVTAGTLRSVPDPSWGAVADTEAVRAGELDPKGLLRTDFEGHGVFPMKGRPGVLAALGTTALGTVVFGDETTLAIAHVANHTIEAPSTTPVTSVRAAADVDGRAALVWTGPTFDAHARVLRPGDDGAVVDLPHEPEGAFCLTSHAAWANVDSGTMTFGGERTDVSWSDEVGQLAGCGREAALFRKVDVDDSVLVCTTECRTVAIPDGAPQGPALALVGTELVAIASHASVLGVWRRNAPPVYYSLPQPALPISSSERTAMAITDGTVIDVVARVPGAYVVIRVPAR